MASAKISALPASAALVGTEEYPIAFGGANYKVTSAQIKTWCNASPAITGAATITGGVVTASTPFINATQTWNNAAVAFTGVFLNITNNASAAASYLVDLQVAGTSVYRVSPAGLMQTTGLYVRTGGGTLGSPNFAAQYHATGAAASYSQWTNSGVTGSNPVNGTLVGIDAAGDGIINVQGPQSLKVTVAGILAFTIDTSSRTVFNKSIKMASSTVAALPAAATDEAGARRYVTDALGPTFGATVVGGGAVGVPVYSDGTNWKVG